MFRSPKYCSRYEYTSIQLDTPIVHRDLPNGAHQQKSGYQFTINDRSSHFDWHKAYFEVKFGMNKLADGATYVDGDHFAIVNGAASLIDNLTVRQNGKTVYDNNRLFITANVKSLVEMSKDYAETTGTNEFYFQDTSEAAEDRADQVGYNKGFATRRLLMKVGANHYEKEINAVIPLNKFSFFEGLEHNMLPPSQIQISLQLSDDDVLVFRTGPDAGRVIVTKLVLWVPRMIFNSDGLAFVMENYMKPRKWTYLREMVQMSAATNNTPGEFRISAGITNPKHVFVFFQPQNGLSSQLLNSHRYSTFWLNDDGTVYLQSAKLEVGNGVYYPQNEYNYDEFQRIYIDVIEYAHKQNDKNTGSLLNVDNLKKIFGMLYFNLTHEDDKLAIDPQQLNFRYTFNNAPPGNYIVYAVVLYEQTVAIDTVGKELIIV